MPRRLTPGAPHAVIAGCTCPVMDNAHGLGIRANGAVNFFVEDGCPIHDENGPDTSDEPIAKALEDRKP